jgi:pimeloyl-ACP methyl ester carboxylesterase
MNLHRNLAVCRILRRQSDASVRRRGAGIFRPLREVRVFKIALLIAVIMAVFWLWTPDRPRSDLEAKYARGPADFLDVSGVRLHVRDSGPKTAPAVIMIHGFGSSLHTWEAWAARLEPDFRVILFDLPATGLSGADPTGIYTDARTFEILNGLMDRLGVARASLVGNSIGGRIAWNFAAQYPGRVDKLVLVSPDGFASPGFEYGVAPKSSPVLGLMKYVLPKPMLLSNLKSSYGDPGKLTDQTVARYHDLLRAPGVRQGTIDRMQQTILTPPEPALARIAAPVLLVWGEKDALIPVSNAADYRAALPDSRLVTFPDLGHVPQEESPDVSLEPVRVFLTQAQAAP